MTFAMKSNTLRHVGAVVQRTLDRIGDLLIRVCGRLGPGRIMLLAAAIYVGLGIVLPVAIGARRVPLILLGAFGAAWGGAITLSWAFAQTQAGNRRHLLEWSTDLRLLSAQEFEWLVGELLRREGWQVEETGQHGAPDGNIDLRIRREGRERLVQCKRWDSRLVPVDEVREMAGTLVREHLPRDAGIVVTLSGFSPQAVEEAAQMGLELVDGPSLLRRIEKVRRSEACPICGTPMLLDRSRHGWWLRCPRFHEGCRGKRDLGAESGRAVELLLGT
jgi:hypothetical protein